MKIEKINKNIFKIIILAILIFGFKFTLADYQEIDVNISPEGVIDSFSVPCSGTNATALLLKYPYPFNYSVLEYMRRPCLGGVVTFDSFNLNEYLNNNGGLYPGWLSYYRTPLKLVIKNTTNVYAPDAPVYNQIISLHSASNNYSKSVLDFNDNIYPTLAVGSSFDFDGNNWVEYVRPSTPPVPIGDPDNLPVEVSSNGDVPRVSINCTIGNDYTLSLVHRDNDVVSYSYGVLERIYCYDGVITFKEFNLNNLLTTKVDPNWWLYVRTPLEYIIKDTTELFACDEYYCPLINLEGVHNNFDRSLYLASSTVWTTVGKGPIFERDENGNWFNIKESEGNSSVLFLPGFMASRLYQQGDALEDQLWEPISNYDVEELYMDENGQSINPDIYTREIIKEINLPFSGQNIYKSFSNMMDNLVSEGTIKEWKSYAYDWRYDVFDILENGTKYKEETKKLEDILENLAENSDNGKVTIVAHSNGGILAKALLKKIQDDKNAGRNNLIDKVDALILVAVPQIGTGKAVPSVLHGYGQKIAGGLIMDDVYARELGKNMPGAYGLLPSREYINRLSASPVSFESGTTTKIFTDVYGNVIDSYTEYKSFLFGDEGREKPSIDNTNYPIILSQNLFTKAENLHNQIDLWTPSESMRVIEVAGWGLDTVAGFNYYSKFTGCKNTELNCKDGYILDARPIFTIDGDKTVVVPSAHYMEGDNIEKYWVDIQEYNSQLPFGLRKDRDHSSVFEVGPLNTLVISVLKKDEVFLGPVVKNSMPLYQDNLLRLSIHSPVKIGAYDSQGNFTGKICPENSDFCYIEENIVNSSYLEFGEGKYLNLPEEELDKVILEGTDIGVFTFEIEKVLPDQTYENYFFKNIPVTPEMKGEFVINQLNELELKIDVEGDGEFDFQINSQNDFDPILYLEIIKKTVQNLDLKENRKNNFIKRIDRVIKLINKGKINKAELKVEKFTDVLEKRLDKEDPKKPKPGRLTKQQAEELLIMLENLLNNLE